MLSFFRRLVLHYSICRSERVRRLEAIQTALKFAR
jgi:hypothetical protein